MVLDVFPVGCIESNWMILIWIDGKGEEIIDG
jgi:hypothetical protein